MTDNEDFLCSRLDQPARELHLRTAVCVPHFLHLPFDIGISSCLLSQVRDPALLVVKKHVPGTVAFLEHTEGA